MFHPHERFSWYLSSQCGCFVMRLIQIGGMAFTAGHRKRMVTGVTDQGSEFTMWWSGMASINLSVILSRRWSLNTRCHSGGLLFSQPSLCLWETLAPPQPPTSVFLVSFASFYLCFYKLCLFSLLFLHLHLWLSEKCRRKGSTLRGVEIFFFCVLGTRRDPSQGTLAFSSHFFPPLLFSI